MAKKTDNPEPLSSSSGGEHRVAGFMGTLLIVVVIVLVFGFFAIRTGTAKQWLESRIGARLGVPVSIEKSRIEWPYDLVIEGLKSAGEADDPPFSVDSLRLRFTLRGKPGLELRGPSLLLRGNVDGVWTPAVFAPLGPLQDIEEISAVTDAFEQDYLLKLIDGRVEWQDQNGSGLASASGIRFSMMPVTLSRRTLIHYELYIRHADGGGGYKLRGVEREWLATEDNRYMELMRRENLSDFDADETGPLDADPTTDEEL